MSDHKTDDEVTLLMLVASSFGVIVSVCVGLAMAGWHSAVAWMVEYQVLAPAAADPIVSLPYAGGAGLDGPRVCVLLAIILLLAYALFRAFKRALLMQAARRLARHQEFG